MSQGRGSSYSGAVKRFSETPAPNINRSSFDRTSNLKTTFNGGLLIPVYVDEMLPGDTCNLQADMFLRTSVPLKQPIMDNFYLYSYWFVVPNRILWTNWERFNGAQDFPTAPTSFVTPKISGYISGATAVGSLSDYFGLPLGSQAPSIVPNAFPYRAYNRIWNEWFRDENLQSSAGNIVDDGPDPLLAYDVKRLGKVKDYFTACLPFPQKGAAVALPLGSTAPIIYSNPSFNSQVLRTASNNALRGTATLFNSTPGSARLSSTAAAVDAPSNIDISGTHVVDLSAATAATINQIRLAITTQQFLERNARGGTRYIEVLKSHFGVNSSNARLDRPELLNISRTPILTHSVAQTSESTAGNPLGELASYATCFTKRHGFTYSAEEHMIVMGFVGVRADLTYQQGMNRMWSRSTQYDYYWPTFSHLGEQAVLNKEIFAVGTTTPGQDDAVFGYIPRYDEYRYKPSMITGQFRSNAPSTLETWHLAQNFASLPVLNATFIQVDDPIDRILSSNQAATFSQFIMQASFRSKWARPMPVHAIPGLSRL